MFNQKNVAFVITDPQVEFLKHTGKGFGATKDVLEKVNTIENLTKLFALAKERGYKRFYLTALLLSTRSQVAI